MADQLEEWDAALEQVNVDHYDNARNKVCEMVAIKHLTKASKSSSDKKNNVAETGKEIIDKLEGVLPPKLSLRLANACKQENKHQSVPDS